MTSPTTTAPAPRVRDADKGLPTLASELWELFVAYLKQETLVPIKGLGRFIALGAAGSLLLTIGLVLLSLAALRALQTETGDLLDGNLSWVPYLATLVAAGAVAAASGVAITRGGKRSGKGRR